MQRPPASRKWAKALYSPSAVSMAETAINAVLQLAVFKVLITEISAPMVGVWVLVNSLLGYARSADFWSRGLSSFIAEERGRDDTRQACCYGITAIVTAAAGFLVLAIGGALILSVFWGAVIGPQADAAIGACIVPLAAFSFWALGLAGTMHIVLLGFENIRVKALLSVGGNVLLLFGVSVLAPQFGVVGAVAAQAAQGVIVLIIEAAVLYNWVWRPNKGGFSRSAFADIAGYGVKSLALGGMQQAIDPLARLVVNSIGGLSAVAIFDLAARLVMTMRGVILAMGQFLVPQFARASTDEASNILRRSEWQSIVFASASFAFMFACAPLISVVIIGKSDTVFLSILWIWAAGWFANICAAPSYYLLSAQRKLRPLFVVHGVMIVASVIGGMVAGCALGLLGALAGFAAGIALSAALQIATVRAHRSARFAGDVPAMRLVMLWLSIGGLTFAFQAWTWTPAAQIALVLCGAIAAAALTPLSALIRSFAETDSGQ